MDLCALIDSDFFPLPLKETVHCVYLGGVDRGCKQLGNSTINSVLLCALNF